MNAGDRFRAMLARRTGVVIEPDRGYLLSARLSALQRTSGFATLESYLLHVLDGGDEIATRAALEAMMTGETFFFRDRAVFETFRTVILPDIARANLSTRRLRIWCAAASTGQEPYSVAMIIDEMARLLRGWQIEIVASDVSEAAIAAAREGSYNQFEVQRGLPVLNLLRYFTREQDRWRICEHLRAMIDFKTVNLTQRFSDLGAFDVMFCRNVLMYFGAQTKQDVLERLGRVLAPGGTLLLGATESAGALSPALEPDPRAPAAYQHRRVSPGRAGCVSVPERV